MPQNQSSRFTKLLQTLGPGLLYAGAAIGVSHLVQSSRAGANFGFDLVWVVIIVNILKYPFFEFGPRYAASTGQSLIEGYQKLGKWALGLFLILTFGTMFTIQAAVTVVTAGLANQLTAIVLAPWQWSAILLATCLVILGIGRYSTLDKLMKGIIIVLTLTTLVALVAAINGYVGGDLVKQEDYLVSFDWADKSHIFFLVALVGWMPAPIDISIWHSVWSLAKKEELGYQPSLKQSLFDFKLGYWGTTFLAICFVSLGALVIHGSGQELESSGGKFAGQLINMYTTSLGDWAWWLIAIAAFTTMFSTTLTCLDAFPRVLRRTTQLIHPKTNKESYKRPLYWVWILVTASGALVILGFFMENMKWMVDLATTMSFLTAPILAIFNYAVVNSKEMPQNGRLPNGLKLLSWIGMLFLTGFSLYYLWTQFIV